MRRNRVKASGLRPLMGLLSAKPLKAVLPLMLALGLSGPARASDETWDLLNNLVSALHSQNKYEAAAARALEALQYAEKTFGPEHPTTGISLVNLAFLYNAMDQYAKALPLYVRALAISEKVYGPDHAVTGLRLNSAASLYETVGEYDRALPLYLRTLAISEKLNGPNHPVTGSRLNDLAFLHKQMGRYDLALPLYLRALDITQKADGPEHANSSIRLNNLGSLYKAMGQHDKALEAYLQALAISEKVNGPEHRGTASRLNNLGTLYDELGFYDKALPIFQRALAISEKANGPEHLNTGRYLNNLAGLYRNMGQFEKALPMYVRALAISEKAMGPDHPATGIGLNNLGALYVATRQDEKALPYYIRALAISEKSEGPEHPSTGISLNNLAGVYKTLGQRDKALPLLIRALAISEKYEGAAHPTTGSRLSNLAVLYEAMGQMDKALPLYLKAYAIANRAGQPDLAQIVQGNLARVYKKLGRQELAIFFGKESVNTIQKMRVNSRGFDRASQESFLQSKKDIYELLAQWLIESGRLPEAQQVLALLKEDELQGFTVRGSADDPVQATVAFQARELGWQSRSEAAAGELGRLSGELEALRRIPAPERKPDHLKKLEALLAEADQAQARFEATLTQIQKEATQAGQQASDEARTSAARAQSGLETLLAKLGVDGGARPAALQYLITEQKLHILVTLPQLQFSRAYPVSARDLRLQIEKFRRALRDPGVDPRPQAQALYKILIEPVAADLQQAGAQHLMVSLTDALRYVPFAALHDGSQYLMQKYQLSMMTEAALGARMDKPRAAWTVSALGVSGKVSPEFSALPAVASELGSIVRSASNPAGALPGQVFMDGHFTAARYRQVIEEGQPVIHIATHFKFSPGTDAQNYLLLGDGQALSLTDMMSRRFKFQNLDLLTLSACETALGSGATDNGREVESLGARAQLQGASAVIATLWQVADESTGQLMKTFYSIRAANPGMNKAEAMRQAQMALLDGKVERPTTEQAARSASARSSQPKVEGARFPADPAKPYAHPFYWAPFVLMGNWL